MKRLPWWKAVEIYGHDAMWKYAEHRESLLFSESDREKSKERTESLIIVQKSQTKLDKKEKDYSMAPPEGYICHTCGETGHWRQRCPLHVNPLKRQKRTC